MVDSRGARPLSPQPSGAGSLSDPSTTDRPPLGRELGVANVGPIGAYVSSLTGGLATGAGAYRVGRDPNAPDIRQLVAMSRRSPQIRALLNFVTNPIRTLLARAEWRAPDGEDPDCPEVKYANDMWNLPPSAGGMTVSKSKFLRQTLLAVPHGFAAFELVNDVARRGPLEGKVVLRKAAYRDPRTVKFNVDSTGGFDGIHQQSSGPDGRTVDVDIPVVSSWYYAVAEEENPFYGVSLLEPAFPHFQAIERLYYIWHLAAQNSAQPTRVAEAPSQNPNPADVMAVKAALSQLGFNGGMIAPFGWKITLQNNNTGFDFEKLINHHHLMEATGFLAKWAMGEQRPTLIDASAGDPTTDMFVSWLLAMANEIAESWTHHLMPKYIDWNFGSGVYPEFHFPPLSDDEKALLETIFTTVVTAGTLNYTPEFVRESEKKVSAAAGFEIDYEKIEEEEKKAAEEQARLAEEQQKMAEEQQAQLAQQAALGDPGQDGKPSQGPRPAPGNGGPPPPNQPPPVPAPQGKPKPIGLTAGPFDRAMDLLQDALGPDRVQAELELYGAPAGQVRLTSVLTPERGE